jgi:phosphoglycolate phosphatase-like HAD superfamily hydrolase
LDAKGNPLALENIRHLIFSFPGILYDDVRVAFSITNKVLVQHGLPEITFERFREIAEGTLDEFIIPHFMPGYDREILRAELIRATKGEPKATLCDGAVETLEELHRQGVSTNLITSKGEDFVQSEIARLELRKYFPDGRVSLAARPWTTRFNPESLERTKAHGIMRILSENDIPIHECAYVGHMENDIGEAQKVGVATIAVDWEYSYNDADRLAKARPDGIVRHIREISRLLMATTKTR